MVAVFVRKKDAIDLLRHDAALLQAQYQLPRAQPAIDKNLAVIALRPARCFPRSRCRAWSS